MIANSDFDSTTCFIILFYFKPFKLSPNASRKSLYEVCGECGEISKQMNIELYKNYLKLNII